MRHRNNAQRHAGGGNRSNQGGNRNRRYNNNNRGGSFDQNDSGNVARIRRHATAQREKYNNMARDQLSAGDRVQAEYYFQHVEHYTRVLNELPPEEPRFNRYNNPQQNPQQPGEEATAVDGAVSDNGTPAAETDLADATPPAESALPAFITGGARRQAAPVVVPVTVPDEE